MNRTQAWPNLVAAAAAAAAAGLLLPLAAQQPAVPQKPASAAAAPAIAIVGARIVPVSGPVIPVGTVVVVDGKIAAVGAAVRAPAGARIIPGKGLSVYPGMMDGDTQVGIDEISGGAIGTVDTNELGAFNPQLVSGVAVNPTSEIIETVRANGITTAMVAMQGGSIPAQASIVDLGVYTNDQMNVRRQGALWINLPGGGGRGGRGGGAAVPGGANPMDALTDYLDAARRYARVAEKVATTDMAMKAMVPYVNGELPVIVPAATAADIRNAIAFGKAQKLKLVIAGARDAWQAIPELKAAGVPVLYGPVIEMPASANDPYDAVYSTPGELAKAGIPFAIVTATGPDSRNLPYNAALAEAYGLSPDDALKSVTLWPAQIYGVDKELGSLEAGKRANLIVTTGDPLDPRTQINDVIIDGNLMPEGRDKRLYEQWMTRPDH